MSITSHTNTASQMPLDARNLAPSPTLAQTGPTTPVKTGRSFFPPPGLPHPPSSPSPDPLGSPGNPIHNRVASYRMPTGDQAVQDVVWRSIFAVILLVNAPAFCSWRAECGPVWIGSDGIVGGQVITLAMAGFWLIRSLGVDDPIWARLDRAETQFRRGDVSILRIDRTFLMEYSPLIRHIFSFVERSGRYAKHIKDANSDLRAFLEIHPDGHYGGLQHISELLKDPEFLKSIKQASASGYRAGAELRKVRYVPYGGDADIPFPASTLAPEYARWLRGFFGSNMAELMAKLPDENWTQSNQNTTSPFHPSATKPSFPSASEQKLAAFDRPAGSSSGQGFAPISPKKGTEDGDEIIASDAQSDDIPQEGDGRQMAEAEAGKPIETNEPNEVGEPSAESIEIKEKQEEQAAFAAADNRGGSDDTGAGQSGNDKISNTLKHLQEEEIEQETTGLGEGSGAGGLGERRGSAALVEDILEQKGVGGGESTPVESGTVVMRDNDESGDKDETDAERAGRVASAQAEAKTDAAGAATGQVNANEQKANGEDVGQTERDGDVSMDVPLSAAVPEVKDSAAANRPLEAADSALNTSVQPPAQLEAGFQLRPAAQTASPNRPLPAQDAPAVLRSPSSHLSHASQNSPPRQPQSQTPSTGSSLVPTSRIPLPKKPGQPAPAPFRPISRSGVLDHAAPNSSPEANVRDTRPTGSRNHHGNNVNPLPGHRKRKAVEDGGHAVEEGTRDAAVAGAEVVGDEAGGVIGPKKKKLNKAVNQAPTLATSRTVRSRTAQARLVSGHGSLPGDKPALTRQMEVNTRAVQMAAQPPNLPPATPRTRRVAPDPGPQPNLDQDSHYTARGPPPLGEGTADIRQDQALYNHYTRQGSRAAPLEQPLIIYRTNHFL